MTRVSGLLLAATLLGSGSLSAGMAMPPAPLPEVEVGDRFVWRSGERVWTETATAIEDGVVRWESNDGEIVMQPTNFARPPTYYREPEGDEGGFVVVEERGELFPLEVGRHTSVSMRSSDDAEGTQELRICTVVGTEQVDVPAGTFDTFKVNCQQRNRTKTYYYAPSIGAIVRYVNTHRLVGSDEQVLVKFEHGAEP